MNCFLVLRSNILCLAASGSNIFAGTSCGGVLRSANNGTNWTSIGPVAVGILSLAVSGNTVFAGAYSYFYRSADNGTTWSSVDSRLTNMTILSFAMNGNRIFAGTDGGGVFLSTDNGTSWTAVNSGLPPSSTVACLAASGNNIFAVVTPTIYNGPNIPVISVDSKNGGNITVAPDTVGMESGLYVSANNGASWTAVNFGPPSAQVFCLAATGNNIFAATWGGVYLSTNNGTSWASVNAGLVDSTVSSITVIPVSSLVISGNAVYAVAGNAVWRRPLSEMIPTNNREFQNKQPSAGNLRININKTNVAVSLPSSDGPVTVELFTIAGKRIYSATHEAASGILSIPLSGLSAGAYLMSITGTNGVLRSSFFLTK
ncbi:MAG TPA: T9SS type A sorting domain-containing protein [Chitinivibrionales bacterium]|nr:T9SS type A sorting domain-containing protein [Chitinivibrionales bacterium]